MENFIICYIIKCGIHYLATFKLFELITFACLTKEFFHHKAISYIAMVKIFYFELSVCVTEIKISNLIRNAQNLSIYEMRQFL